MDGTYSAQSLVESLPNLTLNENGIWLAQQQGDVAYPEEGNEFCFKIEDRSYWFIHRNQCLLTILSRFPPSGAFVDIGGGNGYVSFAIQESGREVILLEPGIHGAIHAKNRGVRQVICSTLEAANFPNQSVSAIGAFDVIEHIKDDGDFFHQTHRILASGGRLYITVPAYRWLWSAEDDFAQHYRRFTLRALNQKLQRAHFKILFATYIFAFLPVPIFLLRRIPYIFGKRAKRNLEEEKDHQLPRGFIGSIITRSMEFELRMLRNLRRIPFGGSCLVVAQSESGRV